MGESCQITDSNGFSVQACLGLLSFLILIYKRQKERPKRFWKIWALDNSKQLLSALSAHSLNVILAVVLSDESAEVDACNWYLVTIIMDTTIGVFFCFVALSLLEGVFQYYGFLSLKSGNYFGVQSPGEQHAHKKRQREKNGLNKDKSNVHLLKPIVKISYIHWFAQLVIWNLIVVGSKSILFVIQSTAAPILQTAVNFILSPLESLSNIKLIIVMAIVPAVLNSIQFWVQDNFLKKKQFNPLEKEYFACQIFEHDDATNDNESVHLSARISGNGDNQQQLKQQQQQQQVNTSDGKNTSPQFLKESSTKTDLA